MCKKCTSDTYNTPNIYSMKYEHPRCDGGCYDDPDIKMSTSTTLEYRDNTGYAVTITIPRGGITGWEFVDSMVRPLMYGIGYVHETVEEALGEEI